MNIQAYLSHDSIACIRIKGIDRIQERTPVHFCVLCDVSGSMDVDKKINNVKKSLDYIVNILTEDDYISIVTFSDKAKIIVPRMSVNEANKSIIQQRIQTIQADGGTNIADGLLLTRECLSNDLGHHKQGILLLTDGQANTGITDISGIINITDALTYEFTGTSISSVGYGTDHNGDLLRRISSKNSGSYNLIETNEHVAMIFGNILGGLVSCTHKNVVIELPEGTTQLTEFPVDGNKIRIGDIQAEGDITILLKNCDVGKEITITGYSIHENIFFIEKTNVIETEDNILLQHGVITMTRIEVVNIMECVRKAVADRVVRMQRSVLLDSINIKRNAIRLMILTSGDNPILGLLLEELTACETTLNTHINSEIAYAHATQVLSQRSTLMATGRGIRHDATPGFPGIVSTPSLYTTIFSNAIQRTISDSIRDATAIMSSEYDENIFPFIQPIPSEITQYNSYEE